MKKINIPNLSLITYNIHKGFGFGRLRFLLPQMRTALSGLKPDFVFLQEVQGQHNRREKRIVAWPDLPQFEYMAGKEWPYFLYAKNAIYKSGHHGNAILSKYPFEKFSNINLSLHKHASRSILHGEVTLTGEEGKQTTLHLLCVHLGLFYKERLFQCETIIERIREVIPEQEPLLMAGDFNDWRNELSQLLAEQLGLQEAFFSLQGECAKSFPAIKPTICIDRIYFRGLEVKNGLCLKGKPWSGLSDHLPLWAEFSVVKDLS
jgi:endonuclease/exonuclease/phosphatase family metal-dependent hydrolase